MKRTIAMFLAVLTALQLASCAAGQGSVTTTGAQTSQTSGEPSGSSTTSESDPVKEQITLETLQNQYKLAVAKAKHQATEVYLVNEPSGFSEKLTLATLQGLVANLSDQQILIQTGSFTTYRSALTSGFGVKTSNRVDKKTCSTATLLAHYADLVDGYILCGSSSDDESVAVAISLAGLLNAVVIPEGSEKLAEDAGLSMVLDVRGKNDAWLRKSEYFAKLNREIAVEQPTSMVPKLADYAVMSHAYFSFYNGHNASEHTSKYSFLNPGAVVFGYNNTLGEYDTVQSFSGINLCMIPADHAYNLSTLSGFCLDSVKQNRPEESDSQPEKVHTVCLILSDGDNMQWLTNDFLTSEKWYASKLRGEFPMGWGVPATAIDMTAPILSYLYGSQSQNDEFIMELSGLGYTFPSKWRSTEREKMAATLSEYMVRSDLKYAEILDDHGFDTRTLSAFTKQEGIDGLFYIDYGNYAEYGGKILWSNGKPIVSAKYRLWGGLSDGSISAISREINRASTDPKSADSYSFIIVHAWSGDNGSGTVVEGGNTLAGIQKLIQSLDSDVQVVTPSVFMDRIIENLKH